MNNILNFIGAINKAIGVDDDEILHDNLVDLFEEMDMPIAVFEDDTGNRYECRTDRQFDEMMDREDVHLVFD